MTATAAISVSTAVRPAGNGLFFPGLIGFFFVFRVCLIFLFFQSNAALGSQVSVATTLLLLFGAFLYTSDLSHSNTFRVVQIRPVRWILALLAFSCVSLTWTDASSLFGAFGYWLAMAADVAIVLLLLRRTPDPLPTTEAFFKGSVWAGAALSLIAWLTPRTPDLRLGNDTFLHPNTLGLYIATATLIAQYLIPHGVRWKWLAIGLAVTLLRTFSKTAIFAFIVAEAWYLLQSKQMSRATKLKIVAAALLALAAFWGVLNSYLTIYNNTASGDQAETLTGRTVVWSAALSMGLEKPWLGHGIFSFKALIPAFGTFEPVHAHNELLQQFFEYGLVGVTIAVGVYYSSYRMARSAPAGNLRMLALSLIIFSMLRGLTDTVSFGLSYPLWLVTAIAISLSRSNRFEAGAS